MSFTDGDRVRHNQGAIGTVSGYPTETAAFVNFDDSSYCWCLLSSLERLVDRTEPHAPNDPGMSAEDVLEKVIANLVDRANTRIDHGDDRTTSDALLAVATEIRRTLSELRR